MVRYNKGITKEEFLQGFYAGMDMTTNWDFARFAMSDQEIEDMCDDYYEIFQPDIAEEIEKYIKDKLGIENGHS